MEEILYDFGTGRSDPSTFPVAELQAAATKVIAEQVEPLTNYPGGLGHEGLRIAMAERESAREGVPVDPDHIILTNGSMQAVTLTAETLQVEKGDTVIVEEYSYPGTLSAYRSLGLEMHGIGLDSGGMRMDMLAERLQALEAANKRPKFIYAISTYQNPTGFVMPKARRLEMIELAARYDIPIVEDNCYADVHYEGPIEPAIFALDDRPEHLYLGSLSKILAPGLRLGYVLARPPMLDKLLARRHDAGSNVLAAAIAAEFYKNGIGQHADRSNAVLKGKRDLLLDEMQTHMSELCQWSKPVGGLFVWVRLPDDVNLKKLMSEAADRGVKYLPGISFHYAFAKAPYLRLAFGHLNHEQISLGIPALTAAIQSCRTSNEPVAFESLFD